LNEDAASAVVRRHAPFSLASLVGEWDTIRRRPDRTIELDLYRRHVAARRVAREKVALTSACVGVLAMTAIYLALFFAADSLRPSNHTRPMPPINATPIPSAADAKF
jgi:hypothetical protein